MDPDRAAELLHAERLRIERALVTRRHQDDAEEADVQDPGNLASDLYQDELDEGLRSDLETQLAAVARAEERLAAGDLPHLAEMLAAGGRTRAITVFPSTTSVAYLPFLTGCTPGRCNIPSIRWMDRRAYGGRWWREREAVRSYCG